MNIECYFDALMMSTIYIFFDDDDDDDEVDDDYDTILGRAGRAYRTSSTRIS